jgi:hypothetical protein
MAQKTLKRLEVARKVEGSNWVVQVQWTLEDGIWVAQRLMPGVNNWADLPDLNTVNMVDVFRSMRDILTGKIDKELIRPVG